MIPKIEDFAIQHDPVKQEIRIEIKSLDPISKFSAADSFGKEPKFLKFLTVATFCKKTIINSFFSC